MTTASVLLTVATAWPVVTDNSEKDNKHGVCLKDVVAETAKELRETPGTREQALQMMRQWVQQNADIKDVRIDDAFLLRFLRHKKYSIPMAQQTLLKYLSLRKYYPDVFKNLDCEDRKIKEIIDKGYIMVSPLRDDKGRRVILYNIGKFDATKFNCWDLARTHMVVYESLLDDPIDQICGFTHIGDGNGITGSHITTWNPTDFARLLKWGEQSVPMRHKHFQLVNVPNALKYIVDFAMSKVSQKISERLKIFSGIKQLTQQIDKHFLPTTYSGMIDPKEMTEYTKQILKENRKKVLALDEMEILSTQGIHSSKNNKNADITSVQGSFRKLEID